MKEKRRQRFLISLIGVLVLFTMLPLMSYADVPQKINYQGYLSDPEGTPIDGTVTVVFSIYSEASGGTALWSETRSVTVTDGVFSVNLGEENPIDLPFDAQYYLGVQVESDEEMTPRQPLTSVGYALRAKEADSVKDGAVTTIVIANEAVTTEKIANDAVTIDKISPNLISSIDGVSNDGGDVDLVAGSNITITPNDGANTITIAATDGGVTDHGQLTGLSDDDHPQYLLADGSRPVSGWLKAQAIEAGNASASDAGEIAAEYDLTCGDDLDVGDDATIGENLTVGWNLRVGHNLIVDGDLDVEGLKNAVVETDSYGLRRTYAMESAEVWFEDFGSGQLENGRVTIHLDPIFLETITIDENHPIKVFITLTADCNGVYVVKDLKSFQVIELNGGTTKATFDYRIVAKRKGYEDERLGEYLPE